MTAVFTYISPDIADQEPLPQRLIENILHLEDRLGVDDRQLSQLGKDQHVSIEARQKLHVAEHLKPLMPRR